MTAGILREGAVFNWRIAGWRGRGGATTLFRLSFCRRMLHHVLECLAHAMGDTSCLFKVVCASILEAVLKWPACVTQKDKNFTSCHMHYSLLQVIVKLMRCMRQQYQAHGHDLPQCGHLIDGLRSGLKKCSRGSVASSLCEMRYLTMVKLVNSRLQPPHSHMRCSGHLHSTCRYWQPPHRNECVPYDEGSTPISRRLLRKNSRNHSD